MFVSRALDIIKDFSFRATRHVKVTSFCWLLDTAKGHAYVGVLSEYPLFVSI